MDFEKDEFARLKDACRRAGLRLTPQRLGIFRELAEARDHPSAEELHRRLVLKFPTLSLDTVYRTLGTLARHGLVHKINTAESQARYEVRATLHHHLICRSCKEIVDFQWAFFDEAALPEELTSWGNIESRNVVAYGLCHKCMEKE